MGVKGGTHAENTRQETQRSISPTPATSTIPLLIIEHTFCVSVRDSGIINQKQFFSHEKGTTQRGEKWVSSLGAAAQDWVVNAQRGVSGRAADASAIGDTRSTVGNATVGSWAGAFQ